jgi:predicted DNA-binding transcriptional regulator
MSRSVEHSKELDPLSVTQTASPVKLFAGSCDLVAQASKATPSRGVSATFWSDLTELLHQEKLSAHFLTQLPQLGLLTHLAVEAGFHELAIQMDSAHQQRFAAACLTLTERARCLFFSKRKSELSELQRSVNLSQQRTAVESLNLFMDQLCVQILEKKWSGDLPSAITLFESQSLSPEKLADVDALFRLEFHNQGGGLYYNRGDYRQSLHHYAEAYLQAEKIQRSGMLAITAYNAWMAASQLDMQFEIDHWQTETKRCLALIELPSLKRTIEVAEIQTLWTEGNLNTLCNRSEIALKDPDLSPFQKLTVMQHRASALLFLGEMCHAEDLVRECRQLIANHKMYNADDSQRALEFDLDYFLTQPRSKTPEAHDLREPRAQLRQLANLCRLSQLRSSGNAYRAHHQELLEKLPKKSCPWLYEDLIGELPSSPHGLEHLALNLFYAGPKSKLRTKIASMLSDFKPDPEFAGPRLSVALGVLECLTGKKSLLAPNVELKNISWLAQLCGYSRFLNKNSSQLQKALQSMTQKEAILAIQWGWLPQDGVLLATHKDGRQSLLLRKELDTNTLLVWQAERRVELKEKSWSFINSEILFQALCSLAKRNQDGLSKDELVQEVWGRSYDPLQDDNLIYAQTKKLRNFVPIENRGGRYFVGNNIVPYLVSPITETVSLTQRQQLILRLASTVGVRLSRQQLVQELQISERTALRELTSLVELGFLEMFGKGRSVHYRPRLDSESNSGRSA